ncbi:MULTISPECIES: aspartyl protease family protein [Stenotrophomonas]|uniref:aspartyl protease family protein n=1 Tax=Stenotrophomonas TaxID=40323 RepID=UPI0013127F60|nr:MULTISPECIES: aspartyl protease family protein [Stenotrophomonas]MBN5160004.1 aspartyl protease family protein [Stenotrophomonas maltophilia]MDG2507428.1 aspartyl protease family protein [Stenotrophomonas maltophilia]MDG9845071.1 aspartyl protease family protein [Stenotrophomonas sp. GD04054]MDH0016388.1 aspartyl protease family protein [Stenotrophomonas sp. GD04028]MDH0577038.1 aspartyl protease family protein [Stenotrophomonas sp. GD03997]
MRRIPPHRRTALGTRRWRSTAIAILTLLTLPVATLASPVADSTCTLPARPGERIIDVPFDVIDGRIHVQVQVNGSGPYRFAIDTGASGMARADSRLVRKLALPADASTRHSDGVQTAWADTVRINALALGGLRHSDVTALTRDYNARQSKDAVFDGILARGFFADGVLIIDYPQRRLQFRRDIDLLPAQPDTLAYARAFRIPVKIGAVSTEAQLDTGANVAMVLPTALFRQAAGIAVTTGDRLTLSHGEVDGGRARLDATVLIGGLALQGLHVRVSERYPEAVVGAHALQEAVVLIDQRSQQVAICPSRHHRN